MTERIVVIEPPLWITSESWQAFHEMRKKIKAPLTAYAEKLIVVELCRLKSAKEDPQACLDQSIRNGWRDVFPLRDKRVAMQAASNDDFERYDAERREPQADPVKRRAAIDQALKAVRRMH
jgi:hypothetical protein